MTRHRERRHGERRIVLSRLDIEEAQRMRAATRARSDDDPLLVDLWSLEEVTAEGVTALAAALADSEVPLVVHDARPSSFLEVLRTTDVRDTWAVCGAVRTVLAAARDETRTVCAS